jgi:hypothetical protein
MKELRRHVYGNQGTIFYRRRTPEDKIIETLAMLAEGSRISSLTRVKGYKEDMILAWLRAAAAHAETIEEELMAKYYQIERGQLDSLWAYVGNKGEKSYPETDEGGQSWRATMIEVDTRLRVARGIAKMETEASQEVFYLP